MVKLVSATLNDMKIPGIKGFELGTKLSLSIWSILFSRKTWSKKNVHFSDADGDGTRPIWVNLALGCWNPAFDNISSIFIANDCCMHCALVFKVFFSCIFFIAK